MQNFSKIFQIFALILTLVMSSLAETLPSLITRYPFGSGEHQKGAESDLNSSKIETSEEIASILEFCGSHSLEGERKFSIRSKNEGKNYWVKLSESIQGYELIKYSPEDRALLLKKGEQKLDILYLRESSRLAKQRPHVADMRPPMMSSSSTDRKSLPQRRTDTRKIIPRDSKPPRILPTVPQFPENLTAPKDKLQQI